MTEPQFQVDPADIQAYTDWTECAAFRFVIEPDGTVRLQIAKSLEEITAPETSDAL